MVQTLELPMLSLAMPNIHKLDSITTDSLSCMWTVFSKCKENLENGRRLENLSWRLWYRESAVVHDRRCVTDQPETTIHTEDSPLPSLSSTVGPSTPIDAKPLKHVSPSSFKRMLTYLGSPTNPIHPQPPLTSLPLSLTPPTKYTSPIIKPISLPAQRQRSSKFFIRSNEDSEDEDDLETSQGEIEDDVWQDDDECVTVSDDCESAYQREFKKQIVRSDRPKCPSLLSRLLGSQCTTTRPIRITGTLVKPSDTTSNSISDSLRDCIDWEHRQNRFNGVLNSPASASYSENIQWW
ncbi:hypothetical protein CLU79DRAFT_719640 [Phycomyces nitens]|nr:hypothetical protein CLU79DRAFT_719640 [Phycomyces nitens]